MADEDHLHEKHDEHEDSSQIDPETKHKPAIQPLAPVSLLNGVADNVIIHQVSSNRHRAEEVNNDVVQHVEPTPSPHASMQDTPVSPQSTQDQFQSDIRGDEPSKAKSIPRSISPLVTGQSDREAIKKEKAEGGACRIHKYWLYETAGRFYVVGGDAMERKFRLLKIDRSADNVDLKMEEDDIVYTKKDMNQLLDTLDDGNKASGGMKLKYSFWGLLGFVRFTGPYYMLLITKKSPAAILGGHYIYQIDGTELISLTASSLRPKADKDPEEARFISILNNLDLTRSFYFSYTYDVTRTLQRNILRERRPRWKTHVESTFKDHNSMFVWNHHFLRPASNVLKTVYDWCLPIVHGFVKQGSNLAHLSTCNVQKLTSRLEIFDYGRSIFITMIARRSRFYAGARFLKRGANDLASFS